MSHIVPFLYFYYFKTGTEINQKRKTEEEKDNRETKPLMKPQTEPKKALNRKPTETKIINVSKEPTHSSLDF